MKKYENFKKHIKVLERARNEDLNNEFIISGIIDKFFVQFESGWKVLKELMLYEGKAVGATGSPREIIKAAYSCYDFMEEEVWLSMLKDRNDLAHIYDEERAKELLDRILMEYIPEFQRLFVGLQDMYGDDLQTLCPDRTLGSWHRI